jgi:excisionase family DNA binding protein
MTGFRAARRAAGAVGSDRTVKLTRSLRRRQGNAGDRGGLNSRRHESRRDLDLLTVAEAKDILGGISAQTLYRLIADEQLAIVKIRRRTFIRRSDVDALIERSTRRTAP